MKIATNACYELAVFNGRELENSPLIGYNWRWAYHFSGSRRASLRFLAAQGSTLGEPAARANSPFTSGFLKNNVAASSLSKRSRCAVLALL